MDKSTLFIDNFYENNVLLNVSGVDNNDNYSFLTGIHPKMDNTEIKKMTVYEILKGLLLYEKIVIITSDLLRVISAFGIEDTIKLVKTGKLSFIDDKVHNNVIRIDNDNCVLSAIYSNISNTIEWLENKLLDTKTNNNKEANILLLNIEKYNTLIDIDNIDKEIIKETQHDLSNLNITNYLNLNSTKIKEISKIDSYSILRLSKLNKSLIYSSHLNFSNIVVDGAVKSILNQKLTPVINPLKSNDLLDSLFYEIFRKKEIPDFTDLYLKNIITIDDYLEIISTLSGKRFIYWIQEKEYNANELEKDILNSNPKISNKYAKFIKWSVPNAIGLLFPAIGISTSFVDNFIFDKLSNGWHPNFFLDNILRERIDAKIQKYHIEERRKNIKKRFPNITRNDKCPCNSGLKLKKCCGRDIY